MEEDSDNIINFESTLKNSDIRKPQMIYKEISKDVSSDYCPKEKYTPKDVLSNVSEQLNALQRADSMKTNKNRLRLRDVVKPALEPVNLLSLDNKRPEQTCHKFETQGVSDTQLINIVVNAEILATPKGATQEFENTFCEHYIQEINSPNVSPVIASKKELYLVGHKTHDSINTEIPSTSEMSSNEKQNRHFVAKSDLEEKNEKIVLSPIICQSESLHPKTSLTVTLDAFENFETIAYPVIEQSHDIDLAKSIINSQIINKELCITCDKPIVTEQICTSPILTNRILGAINTAEDVDKIDKEPFKEPDKVTKGTKKKSIEEDIFCSDEESDEENFKDLPQTCALENCLSNPNDIFDKTMYVGFQTASNKSIQIHADSFSKAQNILEEVDACNATIIELVEMCDARKIHTNANDSEKDKLKSKDKTQQLSSEDKFNNKLSENNENVSSTADDINMCNEPKTLSNKHVYDEAADTFKEINVPVDKDVGLIGFQTASSKKINLSDKALARCRQIFQDINLDEVFDPKTSFNTFCSPINIDSNDVAKENNNIEKDKNELFKLSEQMALNDLTILQEFENDLMAGTDTDFEKRQQENKSENFIGNQKDKRGSDFGILGSNSEKMENQHKSTDVDKKIFVGFKTANNKNIKISDHALAKTKSIFDDIDLFDEFSNEIKKDQSIKTEMHPQQNMEVNTYQNIVKETSNSNITIKNIFNMESNSACGFVTASKKPILVSTEAIIKSKKIFQDIDNAKDDIEMPEKIVLSKSVKNGVQSNSNSKFDTQQTKCSTIPNNKAHNVDNNLHSELFKIPSNNYIKNSNNVRTKSELFKDSIDEFDEICEAKFKYGKENDQQSKEVNNANQVFKGFQTASNKKVNISEKSLTASKKLFEDIQINESDIFNIDSYDLKEKRATLTKKNESPNLNKFENINTESEKLKKMSKEKLQIMNQNISNTPHKTFNGFRSASNKVIQISEEALAKSKNLFSDLDINNEVDEQIENNKDATDVPSAKYNDIDIREIHLTEFNTNNRKISQKSHEKFDDLQSNKRIRLSNELLVDRVSQNSTEENKYISNKPAIENNTPGTINKASKNFELLFKTGNNNNIKISEEALLKSKRLLTDLNQNDQVETILSENNVRKNEGSIENIMNTQLLNNFEDTLYTEDFCKEIPNNKRVGSPILSCPRAKKPKRFEVPYNKWDIPKVKPKEIDFKVNSPVMFDFNKNYKKSNKLSIKTLRDIELNKAVEVDPYILTFNFENSLEFKFEHNRNEISENAWSVHDLKKYFVSLVNRKIIPDGWLDNHLKLIIFKLISYEKEYIYSMQGICSVKNVLEQLKYRYDRELYNVERPAFRKLLEKDDVSTKTMVLKVIAIYFDGVISESMPDTTNIELLLTDGWYCIKGSLDQMLTRLVRDGKIRVGAKLVTNGAELLNCEQGIAPWEDTSTVRLKLFGNSTRRARCDAKLGYHSGAAILSRLSHVQMEGGKVSKLRALVTRVYPTLYVEKFDDGSTVTRSERLEHLYQMKFESDRQLLLEKIYEEVEKEFKDEESQDSEHDLDPRNLETGSQIHRLMKKSRDCGEFVTNLTSTQCATLQKYTDRRRERIFQTLQDRVNDRVREQGLQVGRNVVPVMKIRVADVSNDGEVSKAMLSIWRPNEAVMDIIKEGTWIDAFNIMPTARRYSEIQLSAGRQTVFSRSNYKVNNKVQHIVANLKRTCYNIESLVKMPTSVTDYNEVDVVGLMFLIEPSVAQFETKGQHFQNVYLTDTDKNIICVNFWGGLKKFGYENILDTGLVVACMNLQKRTGNSRKGIPQYRATEYSYFTKTSKHANVRVMMDELNKRLSPMNIKQLCESCVAIKINNSTIKNVENISPYRINYSDYNISKHRVFIDSPLARKPDHVDDILNLTGLDFESTFKQIDTQDVSPDLLLRKKKVNEKIAKLKMYGEPPRLKTIHIINKSKNAAREFKSPLAARNDSPSSVASENLTKKLNSDMDYAESTPETSNKYMKRIHANPVKLNFCSNQHESDGGEKVDPFAEEFDVSPPLSLD